MKTLSTPNVILGVQLNPFHRPPDLMLYRFRVYTREKISILTPEAQKLNSNYQIEGEDGEKLVVRIFKNEDGSFQRGSYYLLNSFDSEIAEYLVKALVQKLGLKAKDFNQLPLKQVYIPQTYPNPENN